MVSVVTNILSFLTVVGDLVIVLFLLDLIVSRMKKEKKLSLFRGLWKWTKKNALALSSLVTVLATLGSLFYSEIAGYSPCRLCWYQRIFMYPQVIIFWVGMYMKEKMVYAYTIVLSAIGAVIAGYHYYIQVFPEHTPEGCSTVGYAASCSDNFVLHFGYVSIPMMAFTAFLLIILGSLLYSEKVKV